MPEHGGDTDNVLAEWLGLSGERIGEIRAGGAIK
jgi:crotonobetainyl-CoA:carnitine CoA-transferase CaiB-like acyl-CoA transferase